VALEQGPSFLEGFPSRRDRGHQHVEHERSGAFGSAFCKALNDGRPSPSNATTSPSMTVWLGSFARALAIAA
jgi:hypothetical protein